MRIVFVLLVAILTLMLNGISLVMAGEITFSPDLLASVETPLPVLQAAPTIDRLAAPPTVIPPTQYQSSEHSQIISESFAWIGIILTFLLFGGGWIWQQHK